MFEDNQNDDIQWLIEDTIFRRPDLTEAVNTAILEYCHTNVSVELSEKSEFAAFELGCQLMMDAKGDSNNVWYVTIGEAHKDLSIAYFIGDRESAYEKFEQLFNRMV